MDTLFRCHATNRYKPQPESFHAGALAMTECQKHGIDFPAEQAAYGLLAVYRIFNVPKKGEQP